MASETHEKNGHPEPAKASPSKAFFVEMLTQDISLSDCILDLVDNSIHSLIRRENLDVMEHLIDGTSPPKVRAQVNIEFTPSKFSISDTCGGISIEEARNQVFLLGKPTVDKKHAGLGVYGIGMKRALFKMGRSICVSSNTQVEEWKINIEVDSWESSDEWDFPFAYAREKKRPSGGTSLEVSRLYPVITTQFGSKALQDILEKRIATAYALFLQAGLGIRINTATPRPDLPEIGGSKQLQPVRKLTREDGVDILIMAGITPATDRDPRGWYVFCNGRMVLAANRTDDTGWGVNEHPAFHSKFNHFIGYVCFRSKDVRKLPWKTTKEGIVRESPVYQRALAEMRIQSRPILDFFNRMYPDDPAKSEPEHKVFQQARGRPVKDIASAPNKAFEATLLRTTDDDLVSIQYKRPKRKIKKLKEAINKPGASAARVGELTFDEFYERHCK
ncbi:MAG TPA: ATP-binding protein [Gemmataceae bacterium]|nr:ATP-binding protein [Gemmataceae bacterium]